MKKRGFFALLVFAIFLISFVSFISAANQTVSDNAYSCLQAKVTSKCSALTTEEKIFSLLAIQSCKSELISDSSSPSSGQCWPSTGCKIKTTSQAILALRSVNADTTSAENWLKSQAISSSDLEWYLQVESNNATSCTANASTGAYTFHVNSDKTVNINSGGNCFSSYGGYWLKISPSCYNQPIQISCHDDFLTSLLYKKQTSATVYVSQKTDSAPAEGTTTETVNSYCFREGNSCSYEGTLWAALVMKSRGYSVSSYIPYLEAMAEDNSQYLPDAFLYYLTGNFQNELASLQQQNQFWSASGDKFYDTAVALLPLQGQTTAEKTNAITWLGQVQGTDGCWQGNIRNTAFLAYSIWPKQAAAPANPDCENSGNHCMSAASCSAISGNQLPDFTGCSLNICCDKAIPLKSCSDQNGKLCASTEVCSGGSVTSSDGACCTGTCQQPQQTTETCASQAGGTCQASCTSDQDDVSSSYTCSSSLSCCVQKSAPNNTWIIVVLVILIALVLMGILFRKKLRMFFMKLKSGKGKSKPVSGPGPRFPPTSSQRPFPAMQRRILPPQQSSSRAPARRPASAEGKSDFDEVLKKLKDIGK